MNEIEVRTPEEFERKSYIATFDQLWNCSGRAFSLDTETTGLNPWKNELIGIGFHCEALDLTGYVPVLDRHDVETARNLCSNFSEDSTIVFHNAKFDLHFLRMNPRIGGWTIMDTTVMVHLLDSRYKKNLADNERRFLGENSKRDYVVAAPARTKIWNWPLHILSAYGANDPKVTWQLAQTLWPKIKELGLESLFWKDMKYLNTLFDVEDYGILVDETVVYRNIDLLGLHLEEMQQELYDACGRTFNWRSPKQLSEAIYGGLGIAKPKNPFADADGVDRSRFADSGKYKSTCTSTFLLTEKVHHPLGELISSMRECDKLRKSFQKWLELMDDNKILHTSFNQTGTRTGRLSSSKPNLQNVASNTRGRFTQSIYSGSVERANEFNMRSALVARPGKIFLSIDYKQMEMRMFGILSQDPFMLNALISGLDVHLEIALKVWGDCGPDLNKVHREWSKTITFGLIYGMTLGSLQYKLNMTRPQAAVVTNQYWAEFPRIKPWMNEIIEICKTNGYLRYWSGRLWKEDNVIDMYKGVNALIQGGCADLLSIASIRVSEWLYDQGPEYHLINLVHDETISEVPEDDILRSARSISSIMTVPDLMKGPDGNYVPFSTDCKLGRNYGDMEKIHKSLLEDLSIESLSLKSILNYDSFEKLTDARNAFEDDLHDEDLSEDEEESE